MKLEKLTKIVIKLFAIYIVASLMFGCRTAKKEWVNENFTSKEVFNSTQKTTQNEINTQVTALSKYLNAKFTEILQTETTKDTDATTVKGSITAEDGKEKSVTIGGTSIKSNGVNLTFEVASTKEQLKEYQSNQTELLEQLAITETKLQTTQKELTDLKNQFNTYVTEQEKASKETSKTGFTFGFMVTVFLVVLGLLSLWYFRKQIPFLNKL